MSVLFVFFGQVGWDWGRDTLCVVHVYDQNFGIMGVGLGMGGMGWWDWAGGCLGCVELG